MTSCGTTVSAHDCTTCAAQAQAPWCAMTGPHHSRLEQSKRGRKLLPGEALFHQGDPADGVYCIESGLVGLFRVDENGSSVLMALAHPGDIVGYRAVIAGGEHLSGAEMLKPGRACFISAATVARLMTESPLLATKFLRHALRDLEEVENRVFKNQTLPARSRLADLLVGFQARYGKRGTDGVFNIELPVSRKNMAAILGVRPETLSRAVRDLEDDGIASFAHRSVQVPMPQRLLAEAQCAAAA